MAADGIDLSETASESGGAMPYTGIMFFQHKPGVVEVIGRWPEFASMSDLLAPEACLIAGRIFISVQNGWAVYHIDRRDWCGYCCSLIAGHVDE
jgi:hypothetical protein